MKPVVKKGSLIKCSICPNLVRLCSDFFGTSPKCPVCRNAKIFNSNIESTLEPNVYTKCMKCTGFFTVKKSYCGKKYTCFVCRELSEHQMKPNIIPTINIVNDFRTENSLSWTPINKIKDIEKDFSYPFRSCIEGDGRWEFSIDNSMKLKDMLDFKKIATICFYQVGENDEKDWILIAKRKDRKFLFFKAGCDYTGFDCQGGGEVKCSASWDHFWNFCLSSHERALL